MTDQFLIGCLVYKTRDRSITFMKLISGGSELEGGLYDCLYLVDDEMKLEYIPRNFTEHELPAGVQVKVPEMAKETKERVMFYTIKNMLRTRNFDEAYTLMCTSKHLIHEVWRWIYGVSPASVHSKRIALRKTFKLIQQLYDDYMTEPIQDDDVTTNTYPVCLLETRTETTMPWDCEFTEILPLVINRSGLGELFRTGPNFSDLALFLNCHEKRGIYTGNGLAYPHCFFIIMNHLKIYSIYKNEERYYYFSRWAMLLQYCFGKHFKSFFYVQGMPIMDTDTDEEEDFLDSMLVRYSFREAVPEPRRQ